MARKQKKLQKSDIHRNISPSISHSIKKIQENERKYTILLVFVFLIVFFFIGFQAFSINSDYLSRNINMFSEPSSTITLPSVFLSSKDIMSDDEGILTKTYPISIANDTNEEIDYRISFVPDEIETTSCGCFNRSFHFDDIRYSLNQRDVLMFQDARMLLDEGVLRPYESKTISVSMWITNNHPFDNDNHFHGYFVMDQF